MTDTVTKTAHRPAGVVTFAKAMGLGATQVMEPQDFPRGRFALVTDPQGATFGILKVDEG